MTDTFPSLREIHRRLRERSLTSSALTEQAIENHRQSDQSLDAYIHFDGAAARRQAQAADRAFEAGQDLGPLQGVPVSVKDLFGLDGIATYAGSSHRLPEAWQREGSVVTRLREQSAVVMGKTHTVEFAFGGLGFNPHWPTPRNPHDTQEHRVPGGSSSGAGVSIGCGSALVALGTDTAGSVRIPASVTGCVGLKTTYGRWPLDGVVPLSPSLDTVGLLTRTVDDAWIAFAAIEGHTEVPQPADDRPLNAKGLSLARLTGVLWDHCSRGIVEAVDAAIATLETAGATLSSSDFAPLDDVLDLFYRGGLAAPEFRRFIYEQLPAWQRRIDPTVWQRVDAAGELSSDEYDDRRTTIRQWCDEAIAALSPTALSPTELAPTDLWISPTVAITPPTVDSIRELDAYRKANLLSLRNTSVANFLRLCAITIPVGVDDLGMPVGLQLMGSGNHDDDLLQRALTVESVLEQG